MQLSNLRAKALAGAILFGAAASATVFPVAANGAPGAGFTSKECSAITTVATEVLSAIGSDKLSKQFRTSLVDFIMPNRKTPTCDGPKNISTPEGVDIDTFNTMQALLEGLKDPHPIYLQRAGIRSVDPSKVATNASVQ